MSTVSAMQAPAYPDDDNEQEINADFSVPVVVETQRMQWQDSPSAGVKRKRIELVGQNPTRLTTLVQFLPGSSFKQHGHQGGEEFLVISGVFSDESGDYGKGCYIRNPSGSFHSPFTHEGCTILVKLCQFQAQDNKQLVILSGHYSSRWESSGEPGVSQLDLHHFKDEKVALFKINPRCWMDIKRFEKGVELFVYQGSISIGKVEYTQGTWLRYPVNSKFKLSSLKGARVYMKQGNFPQLVNAVDSKQSSIGGF